jgi:hypothetical protein
MDFIGIGALWLLAAAFIAWLVLYPHIEDLTWPLKFILGSCLTGFAFLAYQLILHTV